MCVYLLEMELICVKFTATLTFHLSVHIAVNMKSTSLASAHMIKWVDFDPTN